MSDTVTDIVNELEHMDDDRTVGDIISTLEHRGAAPFLIVPPLIEISPVGALPGLPSVLAFTISLFAIQILMGRSHLWTPAFIRNRKLPDDKIRSALQTIRPWAERLDDWLSGGHLSPLVSAPARRAAAALVIGLCALVPPLELIPWASTLPMASILCVGLALLFRNGILMLAACSVSAIAVFTVWRVLF